MNRLRLQHTIAVLSALAGAGVTLAAIALVARDDLQLKAAELSYADLSATEAQRIKATFDRLKKDPEERRRIVAIHQAVSSSPKLDEQLQVFHEWWIGCEPAQREELKPLPPDDWTDEVRRLYNEDIDSDVIFISRIAQPRRRSSNDRQTGRHVDPDELESFLNAALRREQLRDDEKRLVDGIDEQDRILVLTLILFDRLFLDRRNRENHEQLRQTAEALAKIMPQLERRLRNVQNRQINLRITVAWTLRNLLGNIIAHFRKDFLERTARPNEEIALSFTELDVSERFRLMAADPETAAAELRSRLISKEDGRPATMLAKRLANYDSRWQAATRDLRRPDAGRPPRNIGPRVDRPSFRPGAGRPPRNENRTRGQRPGRE